MELAQESFNKAKNSKTKPGSYAWLAFTKLEKKKKVKAKCKICGEETIEIIDSSTYQLWRHLNNGHRGLHDNLKDLYLKGKGLSAKTEQNW
uniref:BED-type domain-containing protein n=1 Tax=Meloidogyne hapla TaxID=6305 RepID=A0A1I8BE32_MELHA